MSNPEHDDRTTDAEAAEQAETDESVSDTGGDSDPGASTAEARTGEVQARQNRSDESPA